MGMLKFTTGQGSIVFSSSDGIVPNVEAEVNEPEVVVPVVVVAEDVALSAPTLLPPMEIANLWQSAHPHNDNDVEGGESSLESNPQQHQNDLILPPLVESKLQSYKAGHICNELGQFPLLHFPTNDNDSPNAAAPYSNNDGTTYNIDVARQLSAVSGWSYSDINTFKDKLSDDHKTSFTNADFMQIAVKNEAMFIVATAQIIRTRDQKVIIVCFRGTEVTNIINWAANASTRFVPWLPYMQQGVHGGFVRNLEAVWYGPKGVLAHLLAPCMLRKGYDYDDPEHFATIADPARNEQAPLEAIYITGHSLGGAMAMLASLDLEYSHTSSGLWNKLRGVYTYGQPMVVSQQDAAACANRIGTKLFRHVYYNDVIPHLPPLSTGDFAHVGREFRYFPPTLRSLLSDSNDSGQWQETTLSGEGVTQIWFVLGAAPFVVADGLVDSYPWLSFVKFSWSILDHNPLRYIDALYGEGRVSERGVLVMLQQTLRPVLNRQFSAANRSRAAVFNRVNDRPNKNHAACNSHRKPPAAVKQARRSTCVDRVALLRYACPRRTCHICNHYTLVSPIVSTAMVSTTNCIN